MRPLPNSTQQTEPVRKARQNSHARRQQTNAILGRRWRKISQRTKCEGKSSSKQQVSELQTARSSARRRKIHAASQDLSRPSTATSYTSIWQEIKHDHEGQEKVRADSQCLFFLTMSTRARQPQSPLKMQPFKNGRTCTRKPPQGRQENQS